MQRYVVLMDIVFDSAGSKTKMAGMLGVKPSCLSIRKVNEGVLCRIESDCGDNRPIIDHVKSILDKFSSKRPVQSNEATKRVSFSIGVMHDTYACSVVIPDQCLKMINDRFSNVDIELACYPTEFSSEDMDPDRAGRNWGSVRSIGGGVKVAQANRNMR